MPKSTFKAVVGTVLVGLLLASQFDVAPMLTHARADSPRVETEATPDTLTKRDERRRPVRPVYNGYVSPSSSTAPSSRAYSAPSTVSAVLSEPQALSAQSGETLGPNLVPNPSVEIAAPKGLRPVDWYKGPSGKNVRKFSYPVAGYSGAKALGVEITGYTSGDAGWYFAQVPVTPGKTYQFTDWYVSNVPSVIQVEYGMTSGTLKWTDIATVPASPSFARASARFTVPSGVKTVTVIHLLKRVGSLTTDSFSLNEVIASPPPSPSPTITSFTATPGAIASGQSATLSWSVTGASSVSINNGVGTVAPTSGSVSVSPTATTTYTLTATNASGSATASLTVGVTTVAPPPPPPPPPAGDNLVPNPGLEQVGTDGNPAGWGRGGWGDNAATYAYPVAGASGNGAKITVTSHASGDRSWYFSPIKLAPGIYSYSESYSATVPTALMAQYLNSDGTYTYKELKQLPASSSFARAAADFYVPEGTVDVTVYHLIRSTGSLTIDDASVVSKKQASGIFQTGAVSFRFDDGWSSQYSAAVPKLSSAGFKASFYIATQQIADRGFAEFMSRSQILELAAAGNEIGSHSRTHVALAQTSGTQRESEISGSLQDLLSWGVSPVRSLAYPYGSFDGSVIASVNAAGYSNAASSVHGHAFPTSGAYQLEMYSVESNTPFDDVRREIDNAASRKTWLILSFHKVDATGDQYSVSPETFGRIVDYVKSKGVPVVTVSDGAGSLEEKPSVQPPPPPPPPPAGDPSNLVPNPSLEISDFGSPKYWSKLQWGAHAANFEYLSNGGHDGSRSVRITMSEHVSGDAKWAFEPAEVTPGATYAFSAWYRSSVQPHATVMFQKSDGSVEYQWLPDPMAWSGTQWRRYYAAFKVPAGTVRATAFMFIDRNGWLETDDYKMGKLSSTGFSRPMVTLTFDDGFEENTSTALPILEKYGLKSTQCYATTYLEGNAEQERNIMSFVNAGHEICSHSVTHPDLTQVSAAALDYELRHSKEYLERLTGGKVTAFSSPFGAYDPRVTNAAGAYYSSHRTANEGYNSKAAFDPYQIKVRSVYLSTPVSTVKAWVDEAAANNEWLVLLYHMVSDTTDDPVGTRISAFDQEMSYIKQKGVTVLPLSAALAEAQGQL